MRPILFTTAVLLSACATAAPPRAPMPEIAGEIRITPTNQLRYQQIDDGTGAVATAGACAYVHYTGYRTSGQFIETSRDTVAGVPPEPIVFVVGSGRVIRGWDIGVTGMKVGGIRRLFIPPELGYGNAGAGKILGGVSLVFDVQLMAVEAPQQGRCIPWGAVR